MTTTKIRSTGFSLPHTYFVEHFVGEIKKTPQEHNEHYPVPRKQYQLPPARILTNLGTEITAAKENETGASSEVLEENHR
jgi:hypothetical protein